MDIQDAAFDETHQKAFPDERVRLGGTKTARISTRMQTVKTYFAGVHQRLAALRNCFSEVEDNLVQLVQLASHEDSNTGDEERRARLDLQRQLAQKKLKLVRDIRALGKENMAHLEKFRDDNSAKNRKILNALRELSI